MLILLIIFFFQIDGSFDSFINHSSYNESIDTIDTRRIVKMTFSNPHQDLGTIKRGEKRELNFDFLNRGNEDLKIELVSACECTTLDWPRKPVSPGETGTIHAFFDSTEKEVSETIEIDIYLENTDPKTNRPILEIISFKFEMVQ